ncbi:MAG TPA: luciferase family protein [Chthoniobacterales bacterium]
MSDIEAEVRRWPHMKTGVHRFGGIDFRFRGKEAGHIHGNGLLDCLVGRRNRDALVIRRLALPHHIFPKSGWISFWIRGEDDVRAALDLIRIAISQNQRRATPLDAETARPFPETTLVEVE